MNQHRAKMAARVPWWLTGTSVPALQGSWEHTVNVSFTYKTIIDKAIYCIDSKSQEKFIALLGVTYPRYKYTFFFALELNVCFVKCFY